MQSIQPVSLLDAAEGISDVEDKLVDACISKEIPVYARLPQKLVAVTLGMAGYTGVLSDLSDEELEDGSRILVDYSSADKPIIDHRIELIRLAASDLQVLRDDRAVTQGEFSSGGLINRGREGFEFVDFDECRLAHFGSALDPFSDPSPSPLWTIEIPEVLVDLNDVPRVRALLLSGLEVEDRWGHRVEAPAVHLIYRAAQHFADKKYSFQAAKEWIRENDEKGLFEAREKALDYAARLINRNPTKKSVESAKVLRVDKITHNETGKDYTESAASNRLRLLHLATDCWIHDKKFPSAPFLPKKGGLWAYLRGLGFTTPEDTGVVKGKDRSSKAKDDHVVSAKECQVEYLRWIIESHP